MSYLSGLGISERTAQLFDRAEQRLTEQFYQIERRAEHNAAKVLQAFWNNGVSDAHFGSTTGYGYDDLGRETLDKIYAEVFGGEDALVRHSIVSGTHALALCLYGLLRPGDVLLSAAGKPYDTLEEVIGISGQGSGSLKEFGVEYRQAELTAEGKLDIPGVLAQMDERVKVVWLQKSKGYGWRDSLNNKDIGRFCRAVKEQFPKCICAVDNCYGEFVEEQEPLEVGADLIAGSLIKNPGGGLAPGGAYIAGKHPLVELASYRLTAPGIGRHEGATLGNNRSLYQGLFMAPHTVAQNLKTAALCGAVLEDLGFAVHPSFGAPRYCTIQAVRFEDEKKLISFCQGIQKGSPVDSFAAPQPWAMPGYQHQVIMAAGTFVQGATSELSADAPIKEPYIAYVQGGLTYETAKIGLMKAVQNMMDEALH
ncbi:MAG: methionine gamma-lyase family protein [Clostridia bacterium]|nr:methionine gamma-lyase family protein [Clostridia bacterium]